MNSGLLLLLLLATAVNSLLLRPEWAAEGEYITTPLGKIWSDCLFHIPSNSHIIESPAEGPTKVKLPDGSIEEVPSCQKKRLSNKKSQSNSDTSNGWQAFSAFDNYNNASFSSFLGDFNVPDTPEKFPISPDAILYMFTGLQSDNWVPYGDNTSDVPSLFDIIQPVLQYGGGSSGGGGKYWAIASWYVTVNAGYLVSDLVKVNPGDIIFGNMTQTGTKTWFILSQVNGGVSTSITVTRDQLLTQPWAYNTLEVYNILSCDWFPTSPITFSNLVLTDSKGVVQPEWDLDHPGLVNPCGNTIELSGNDVIINFPSN